MSDPDWTVESWAAERIGQAEIALSQAVVTGDRWRRQRDELLTALRDTYGDLQQIAPGFAKPYVEALIERMDAKDRGE